MFMISEAVLCHCRAACCCNACFRVELFQAADAPLSVHAVNTCAEHLGQAVQDLSGWAATRGISEGLLSVSVIDTESREAEAQADALITSFPFACIPVTS